MSERLQRRLRKKYPFFFEGWSMLTPKDPHAGLECEENCPGQWVGRPYDGDTSLCLRTLLLNWLDERPEVRPRGLNRAISMGEYRPVPMVMLEKDHYDGMIREIAELREALTELKPKKVKR